MSNVDTIVVICINRVGTFELEGEAQSIIVVAIFPL